MEHPMLKVGRIGNLSNTYLPIMVANQMNMLATNFSIVMIEADKDALPHEGQYGEMVCAHLIMQAHCPFSVVRVFFSEEENAVIVVLAGVGSSVRTVLKCPRDKDFEILTTQRIRLGPVTYNFQ
jgi:hypothetical protein